MADDETRDETSEAPAESAETPDPAPVAEEQGTDEPVAEEAPVEEIEVVEEVVVEAEAEAPKAEEKKKDVIPGADLEPIAVEPKLSSAPRRKPPSKPRKRRKRAVRRR